MRELKFRAWDIKRKEMFFVDCMVFRTNNDVYRVWKNVVEPEGGLLISPITGILMQYVGVKDKNNVEIYEGDIVKVKEDTYHHTWEVVYLAPSFVFRRSIKPIWVQSCHLGHVKIPDTVEIIGNIYENEELLK